MDGVYWRSVGNKDDDVYRLMKPVHAAVRGDAVLRVLGITPLKYKDGSVTSYAAKCGGSNRLIRLKIAGDIAMLKRAIKKAAA